MAAKIWSVALRQGWGDTEMITALHVQNSSGTAPAQDIADAVAGAWCISNSFADVVQTTDISYLGFRMRNITDNLATVEADWNGSFATGQISSETIPPSVAMCYTIKTTLAGRSHRGRIYLGGLRHQVYASGQTSFDLSGSAGVLASGAGEAFRSECDNSGNQLVVYSRHLASATVAFSVLPHPGLASQRKRANRFAAP